MTKASIKKGGANVVVQAYGEVLFLDGGEVNRWTRRFSAQIKQATINAAPSNKRPRWGHYGEPLKATIKSAPPNFRETPGGARLYAAVGSSAPHAYYVDQGTGIYNGGAPYEAKILPPWHEGSASLYEHTWRPAGPEGRKVAPVMIRGQKGQHYFDAGLDRAFGFMRLQRRVAAPVQMLSGALNATPEGIADFLGNTEASDAFEISLKKWRAWRDEAWGNYEGLGRGGGIGSKAQERYRREMSAIRDAYAQGRGGGIAKYRASKKASEDRKQKQLSDLKAEQKRKEEGRKKAEEKQRKKDAIEAKEKQTRKFEQSRREAYEYMHAIEKEYPDAQVLISSSKQSIIVQFTGPDGQVYRQYFLGGAKK